MPTTEIRCALFSSAEAWKSSLTKRSSRSRPTKGGSSPPDLSAPPRPAVTRSARKSVWGSYLVAESGDGSDEVECSPYSALGVVLLSHRRAPDRHHRVANELLDRATVERDQALAGVEVAREELAHLFGVSAFRERRKADQMRK